MLLEFEYTDGYSRNTIVDLRDQKIYYLDDSQGSLDYYLEEYLSIIGTDYQSTPLDINKAGVWDILELENVPLKEQIKLAGIGVELLIDFLLIHCRDALQYNSLMKELDVIINAGNLGYRRIYIVIDDNEFSKLPKVESNIYHVLSTTLFHKKREVSKDNFVLDSDTIIESHNFNTFFNRRLIINESNYVQIMDICAQKKPLLEISTRINKLVSTFDLWEVSKSKLAVCRDCDYRKICVDSSNIIPTNGYFKRESECRYNPYIAKWDSEEGYETIAESIVSGVVTKDYIFRKDEG